MPETSNLIRIREHFELSRYKVAQDTGIPYDTLARIEDPSTPTVRREHIKTLYDYYRARGRILTIRDFIS